MKFTTYAINEEFTVEDLMEDLLEEIANGEYRNMNDLLRQNERYFSELTDEETATLEEAFTEYEDAEWERQQEEAEEAERQYREWLLEQDDMNREYWNAVVVA